MRPVLLIATNFLREQRWLTLVLVLYAFGLAAVFGLSEKQVSAEDAVFFLRQQSLYAPLFSLFLAVTAIHNERKSRRILAVLSKALTRLQYIAGLLVGILAVVGIYCLAIAIAGTWLAHSAQASVERLWILLGMTAVVSALVSAVAMFFSTFLNPVFATAATALAGVLPAGLGHAIGRGWENLLPIYSLVVRVSETTLERSAIPDWHPLAIALGEALLFWALASWIFAGRDIATAVE
jgi:ABC-type transport system involved in multi-copper enzyme maturation permease subunit